MDNIIVIAVKIGRAKYLLGWKAHQVGRYVQIRNEYGGLFGARLNKISIPRIVLYQKKANFCQYNPKPTEKKTIPTCMSL